MINTAYTPGSAEPISAYCRTCSKEHSLPVTPALPHCHDLMELLESHRSIYLGEHTMERSALSTDYLWSEARGKMFGILVTEDQGGHQHILKAFSGQYNGIWNITGWVPPVFNVDRFYTTQDEREKEIKQLSREIDMAERDSDNWQILRSKRKHLSRSLMQDIFNLYHLQNSKGIRYPLARVFANDKIPTGTGDCCAPKLLHHAAVKGLRPVAMAEFYWGKENKSGTRQHGRFYPPCTDKCMPLLGFLLCGTDDHA